MKEAARPGKSIEPEVEAGTRNGIAAEQLAEWRAAWRENGWWMKNKMKSEIENKADGIS